MYNNYTRGFQPFKLALASQNLAQISHDEQNLFDPKKCIHDSSINNFLQKQIIY